ncbi:NAD-dependent succinate-semialdehyde dehydrogenase [Rhodoligotrophos defluvii]|uniref:NAD-dependent succinate-semialdehyde dehydrogenase n=1 Tax=Rhodoligotrophos defluvii TaxID=2561934 RepID=UPI0010C93753|nr:NAD-dependent succinate-semialdehyde dehydrogenase [Rhodoligotrophos defluvii]
MYPDSLLHIDGVWCRGAAGKRGTVLNPATGTPLGHVEHADIADLDRALGAVEKGFRTWRRMSAYDRYRIMRKAADLLRERADEIARIMTLEQGKPLADSHAETLRGADTIDWFAEEGRRAYGKIVPSRAEHVQQYVVKEPVGPVAAFTPWNFPINQAVRKVAAALACGCSVILKGPEETPASCAALVQAFIDAGTPAGVVNLVFGVPAMISEYLIPHPVIRKISFTGSTAVGKHLASLAGRHMKRVTMELGGHSPVLVFDDADLPSAIDILVSRKFRNAGQTCTSPSRLLVQDGLYDRFVDAFITAAEKVKVGDGLEPGVEMGPLAHVRRLEAMEALVADAIAQGGRLRTGGHRIGNRGYFFAPTVLTEVPVSARIMNEEPFGPVLPILRFSTYEEAMAEANRLAYGLTAYAYTRSARIAADIARDIESGMVSINHQGLGMIEVPFGGVKDSGYGSEGGSEAMDDYLVNKVVTLNIL